MSTTSDVVAPDTDWVSLSLSLSSSSSSPSPPLPSGDEDRQVETKASLLYFQERQKAWRESPRPKIKDLPPPALPVVTTSCDKFQRLSTTPRKSPRRYLGAKRNTTPGSKDATVVDETLTYPLATTLSLQQSIQDTATSLSAQITSDQSLLHPTIQPSKPITSFSFSNPPSVSNTTTTITLPKTLQPWQSPQHTQTTPSPFSFSSPVDTTTGAQAVSKQPNAISATTTSFSSPTTLVQADTIPILEQEKAKATFSSSATTTATPFPFSSPTPFTMTTQPTQQQHKTSTLATTTPFSFPSPLAATMHPTTLSSAPSLSLSTPNSMTLQPNLLQSTTAAAKALTTISSISATKTDTPSKVSSASYRDRLVAFYEKHNPAKLDTVDATLEKYVGREEELFDKLAQKYASYPSATGHGPSYYLQTSLGRIVVRVFADKLPYTAANFGSLCTGKAMAPANRQHITTFRNTPWHRVVPGLLIQGGDTTSGNGTGGRSAFDPPVAIDMWGHFHDERPFLAHDRPGLLSMANIGPNTNSSQFFITLKAMPHLNGKHVVFGQVIDGMHVVQALGNLAINDKQRPIQDVSILDCGQFQIDNDAHTETTTNGEGESGIRQGPSVGTFSFTHQLSRKVPSLGARSPDQAVQGKGNSSAPSLAMEKPSGSNGNLYEQQKEVEIATMASEATDCHETIHTSSIDSNGKRTSVENNSPARESCKFEQEPEIPLQVEVFGEHSSDDTNGNVSQELILPQRQANHVAPADEQGQVNGSHDNRDTESLPAVGTARSHYDAAIFNFMDKRAATSRLTNSEESVNCALSSQAESFGCTSLQEKQTTKPQLPGLNSNGTLEEENVISTLNGTHDDDEVWTDNQCDIMKEEHTVESVGIEKFRSCTGTEEEQEKKQPLDTVFQDASLSKRHRNLVVQANFLSMDPLVVPICSFLLREQESKSKKKGE